MSDLASKIYHPRPSAEKSRLAIQSQLFVKSRKKRSKAKLISDANSDQGEVGNRTDGIVLPVHPSRKATVKGLIAIRKQLRTRESEMEHDNKVTNTHNPLSSSLEGVNGLTIGVRDYCKVCKILKIFIFLSLASARTRKYKTLKDFHRHDTYAKYVKIHISIGMKVRCHFQLLKLDKGAIGTVTQIHDEDNVLSYNLEVNT